MNISTKQKFDLWVGLPLIFFLKPLVYLTGLVLKRSHDLSNVKDIVFIKMQGGGSLVIALPALLGLRRQYPDKKIKLVTVSSVVPFAKILSVFDEIIIINDRSLFSIFTSGLRALFKTLNTDVIIDLEVYSFLSVVFGIMTLAKNRIGFYLESVFWRKHLFTHLIFFNRYSGTYHFYEDTVKLLGAFPATNSECQHHLINSNSFQKMIKAIPRFAIGHGCSDFGKERMLTAKQWSQFIKNEIKSKAEISFLGVLNDYDLAEEIIRELRGLGIYDFKNFSGKKNLKESIDYLNNCDGFLGIDSSLLHFSRILRIPTTSFWGPTDPNTRLKPDKDLVEKFFYKKTPCSPCIHVAEEPPCRGKNICISGIFSESEKNEFNSFVL